MKIADMKAEYIQHTGSDLMVVNAARVSHHKESALELTDSGELVLSEADKKLIRYLFTHKHHSPFNHAFLTVRMKAPIFVARQLVKHKFMPWNEVSRRYVDDEPEFYFPEEWRKRGKNVKQGSSEERCEEAYDSGYSYDDWYEESANDQAELLIWEALVLYNRLLQIGVCPEQARMMLPQTMMTEWYWSGTLGAFLDMLTLRLDPHTQKETREAAKLVFEIVKQHFPYSVEVVLGDVK